MLMYPIESLKIKLVTLKNGLLSLINVCKLCFTSVYPSKFKSV